VVQQSEKRSLAGRSGDPPTAEFSVELAQRLVFRMGYKYPSLWAVFIKNFKSKNFHLLKCFSLKF